MEFYIKGTHRNYKNVVWIETIPAFIGFVARPCANALHAHAFDNDNVEMMRQIFSVNYPDYEWTPVSASSSIIPENMRKAINL